MAGGGGGVCLKSLAKVLNIVVDILNLHLVVINIQNSPVRTIFNAKNNLQNREREVMKLLLCGITIKEIQRFPKHITRKKTLR